MPTRPESDLLEGELERAWLLELNASWSHFNNEYLDGALRRPSIRLSSATRSFGSWDRDARVIRISAEHIRDDPWLEVLATLRHEMAHQLVDELQGKNEPPHGAAFRDACETLRVSPRPCSPAADRARPGATSVRTRLLERVAKLLSLGASPNEHEAQAALRKARGLLLEHNIELAEVRADRSFSMRELGPVKRRHQGYEYTLSGLLNEFFFVETIWARSFDAKTARGGTALQLFGTEENLEMAVYVHECLTRLLEELWRSYRRREGLPGNRERMRYYEGVLVGFLQKLRDQDRQLAASDGLVYRGDSELRRFFKAHNPRVRTYYTGGVRSSAAYEDGKREGRDVTINRPLRDDGGAAPGYIEARG